MTKGMFLTEQDLEKYTKWVVEKTKWERIATSETVNKWLNKNPCPLPEPIDLPDEKEIEKKFERINVPETNIDFVYNKTALNRQEGAKWLLNLILTNKKQSMKKEEFIKLLAANFGGDIICVEDIPNWGWKKGFKTKIDINFIWDCENYTKGTTVVEEKCNKYDRTLSWHSQAFLPKDFWEYFVCPHCNGEGKINNTPKDFIGNYGARTCDTCRGNKYLTNF